MPRSERQQGMLGEVFEVAEQCARPVSAINWDCGIGGWGGVNMVREEWGIDGVSETRGSRTHFRSKCIPPKHTEKDRPPRFAHARGHHPMRASHLP
jgi:hypothetical protein